MDPRRHHAVPPELVDRVREFLAGMPDTRPDRIADARKRLEDAPSAEEVADKMIARIISDSLR